MYIFSLQLIIYVINIYEDLPEGELAWKTLPGKSSAVTSNYIF